MTEHVRNDFTPLNRAVNNEVGKHRAHTFFRHSRTFLNVCLGLGALLLLSAVSCYIHRSVPTTSQMLNSKTPSAAAVSERRVAVAAIAARPGAESETDSADFLPPEKEYTEFLIVYADSGEQVVTAKRFPAGDLDHPTLQYCYLKGSDKTLSGERLAELRPGSARTILAKNETLRQYAAKYCRFDRF